MEERSQMEILYEKYRAKVKGNHGGNDNHNIVRGNIAPQRNDNKTRIATKTRVTLVLEFLRTPLIETLQFLIDISPEKC